jgi:hypothetical protein
MSDGLSYLDIASEVNRGDLSALANPYWSPAYPAFIWICMFLLRPSPAWEVPLLQLTNFLMFTLALAAFTVFLRSWTQSIPEFERASSIDKGLITFFSFASFLCFTSYAIPFHLTTPDMLVEATVFIQAAIGCRVTRAGAGWTHFIWLGALLGVGIYVKAALFPLAFAFIALLFVSMAWNSELPRRRQLAYLALTTLIFAVVSMPLIVFMSAQQGRLTAGETGRLNYVWNVDKVTPDHVGWTGDTPPAFGTPLHPPRKLMEVPLVLEFATPVGGTYPLWHSPAYWYAGINPVFNLHNQLLAIRASLHAYLKIAIDLVGFTGGAILLFILGMFKSRKTRRWRFSLLLVGWPLAAIAMYAIVTAEPRYVVAFLLILCLEIYRALIFRVERRVAIGVCAIVLLVALVPLALSVAGSIGSAAQQLHHPKDVGYVIVGKNLGLLGLQPGDQVAVIGYAKNCYYARYARLRVVAQIPTSEEFWRLDSTDEKRVLDRLTSIGVKAVIAVDRPASNQESGWSAVGMNAGASVSARMLQPASDAVH